MTTVRIAGSKKHSLVNGPGVRFVLFFQGCPHACPGCQNPETWDPFGGQELNTEILIRQILDTRYLDGVTFSGGDPLWQPEAALAIARAVKNAGLSLWIYTGWTWEQLWDGAAGTNALEAVRCADVVVDGPFMETLKTDQAIWRGSSNQRLINVSASLTAGHIITISE